MEWKINFAWTIGRGAIAPPCPPAKYAYAIDADYLEVVSKCDIVKSTLVTKLWFLQITKQYIIFLPEAWSQGNLAKGKGKILLLVSALSESWVSWYFTDFDKFCRHCQWHWQWVNEISSLADLTWFLIHDIDTHTHINLLCLFFNKKMYKLS